MESRWADLDGPVHYLDFGGHGSPVVLVHGLGGMAWNWLGLAPGLAQRHRVLAIDLRGFGRTPVFGHVTTVAHQRALLDRFLSQVVGEPAVLAGNSMGGLVSVLEAAANPHRVTSLALLDPAIPGLRPWRTDPTITSFFTMLLLPGGPALLADRSRRMGAEGVLRQTLAVTMAHPERADPAVLAAHLHEARERLHNPHVDLALAQAGRSLLQVLFRGGLGPLYASIRRPVMIVHGERDRLVPAANSVEIGRRHGWPVTVLDDTGHVPMLEEPDRVLELINDWLASTPAEAV